MKTKLFHSALFAASLATGSTENGLLGIDVNGKFLESNVKVETEFAKAIDEKIEISIEDNTDLELVDNFEGVFFSIVEK